MRAFPLVCGHSRGGGGAIGVVNHWIAHGLKASGYTVNQIQLLKHVRWFRSVYSMTLNPASFGSVLADESLGTRHDPGDYVPSTSLFGQNGDISIGGIFSYVNGHGSVCTFVGYTPLGHVIRPAILQHVVHRTSGDIVSHFIHTSNANLITGAGSKCDSNLFVIDVPERITTDLDRDWETISPDVLCTTC